MGEFNLDQGGGLLTALIVYGGMITAALWLAMIIWTFRDMRARSRDTLAQIVVAVMVAVLTVPGLVIYLFLRPRETLAEAYERSLEEEALLQEIEEKPSCPGCRQRVQEDWQACPHCHTRLKKPCPRCGKMLELAWDLCPHCASALTVYTNDMDVAPVTTAAPLPAYTASSVSRAERRRSRNVGAYTTNTESDGRGESLQFVDGDEG